MGRFCAVPENTYNLIAIIFAHAEYVMKTYLIISLIADDKPGLIEDLAIVVSNYSGNWLESNMSHLAGKFAGIFRVSVDDAKAELLANELRAVSTSFNLQIEYGDESNVREFDAQPDLLTVNIVGNDRPGIVMEISQALAQMGVNVESFSTMCEAAPMSGEVLFKLDAVLKNSRNLDSEKLKTNLELLADDLIIEIE